MGRGGSYHLLLNQQPPTVNKPSTSQPLINKPTKQHPPLNQLSNPIGRSLWPHSPPKPTLLPNPGWLPQYWSPAQQSSINVRPPLLTTPSKPTCQLFPNLPTGSSKAMQTPPAGTAPSQQTIGKLVGGRWGDWSQNTRKRKETEVNKCFIKCLNLKLYLFH